LIPVITVKSAACETSHFGIFIVFYTLEYSLYLYTSKNSKQLLIFGGEVMHNQTPPDTKKILPALGSIPQASAAARADIESIARLREDSRLKKPIRNLRENSRAISKLDEEDEAKPMVGRLRPNHISDDFAVGKSSLSLTVPSLVDKHNSVEGESSSKKHAARKGIGLRRMGSVDDNDVPSNVYNNRKGKATSPRCDKCKSSSAGRGVNLPPQLSKLATKDNRTTFQRMRSRSVDFSDEGPSSDEEDDFRHLSPRSQLLAPLPDHRPKTVGGDLEGGGKRLLRRKTSEDDIQVGGFRARRTALNICHVTNMHPHMEEEYDAEMGVESPAGTGIRGDGVHVWGAAENGAGASGQGGATEGGVGAGAGVGAAGSQQMQIKAARKTRLDPLHSPHGELVCTSPLLFWRCHLRAIVHIYFHDEHECYEVVAVDAKLGTVLPHLYLSAAKIFDLNEVALSKSQTLEMRLKKRSSVKKQRVRLGAEYILASLDAEYVDETKTATRLFIRKFKGTGA
jgi:hypothetical protein